MIAGAGAADPAGVGEDEVAGVAGRVLVDGHQAGDAATLGVLAPDQVAGPFGATMPTSTPGGGSIWPKWMEKPWAKSSRLPGAIPSAISASPDLGLLLVGQQDHHDVAAAGGVGDVEHLEPCRLGLGAAGRVGAQPDDDVDARVLQVERVGVALRAVAEDRDGLALELGEVGVLVVEDVVCAHG